MCAQQVFHRLGIAFGAAKDEVEELWRRGQGSAFLVIVSDNCRLRRFRDAEL